MNAREYYLQIQKAISSAPLVLASDVRFVEVDVNEGYICGSLTLINGYQLHIAEYVVTELQIQRLKYRYHLQAESGKLVVRWDDVPHHPTIDTYPFHIHRSDGTIGPSLAMDLSLVLQAIVGYIPHD